MSRIFLSHSSANNAQALALAAWLDEIGRGEYFLDISETRGIVPGERWLTAFTGAVDRCEAVVFLLSPAWQQSKYCFAEFTQAERLGKRLFGVIVEPIPMESLPEQLTSEWQVCDLTQGEMRSFEVERAPLVPPTTVHFSSERLDDLERGLRKAGLDPSTFVWPPPDDPRRAPYPGLRAMDEADAAVYFGRDAAIVSAIDRIRLIRERNVEQMFVVLGASGAGKSSFLRAGLLPRLRRDSEHFIVLPPVRPARNVLTGASGLLGSLQAGLRAAGSDLSLESLRRHLEDDPLALLQRLEHGAKASGGVLPAPGAGVPNGRTVVIPIDQAEELFHADAQDEVETLRGYLHALQPLSSSAMAMRAGALGHAAPVRVLLLLTIRSDALSRLQADAQLQALAPVLYSLPAMPDSHFKDVIEGPAERHSATVAPLRIAPALTERLVADAQGADALPLLALTLDWLYREFTTSRGTQIGPEEYERLGGTRGVIQTAVRRALAHPEQEPEIPSGEAGQDALLRELFPRIATVDPYTREPRRSLALRDTLRARPELDAMAMRLVEQRLLLVDSRSVGEGAEPVEVVEIAHEALLRQWPLLEQWLQARADDLAATETVHRNAQDWQRAGKEAGLLAHTGRRLSFARGLLEDEHLRPRFDAVDLDYLDACQARDAEEQRRRDLERAKRHAGVAGLVAVVVLTGALVWTGVKTQEISRLNSTALASASEAAADQDRVEESLRLAILAANGSWLRPSDPSARTALARAATANRLQLYLPEPARQGGGVTAAFSPDGRSILTASRDGRARLWDARSGALQREYAAHEAALTTAVLQDDGLRALTASNDHTARLWNLDSGDTVGAPIQHPGAVLAAAVSGDGRRVLTAAADGLARLAGVGRTPVALDAGGRDRLFKVAFNRGDQRVMVAGRRAVTLHDAISGARLVPPLQHCSRVLMAGVSADGRRVVTADERWRLQVWNATPGDRSALAGGLPLQLASLGAGGLPEAVAISSDAPDEADFGEALPGRDPFSNGPLKVVSERRPDRVAISPDGRLFMSADADGAVVRSIDDPGRPFVSLIERGSPGAIAFSPDGRAVLRVSGRRVRVAGLVPGDGWAERLDHDDEVLAAAFSADGTIVVTGSRDGRARLWDARHGSPWAGLRPLPHGAPVIDVALDAQRRRVATLGGDGRVRLWSAETGRPLGRPIVTGGASRQLRFSPEGERLVGLGPTRVQVWRVADGALLHGWTAAFDSADAADVSVDGRRVLSVAPGEGAQVWDLASGRPIGQPMRHDGGVTEARFSADGRRVMTVGAEGSTRVWDAETGAPAGDPLRACGEVRDAQFSPDGRRVLTAADDGSVQLWSADDGRPDGRQAPLDQPLRRVRFAPDGREFVIATEDGTVQRWSVEPRGPVGVPLRHPAPVRSLAYDEPGARLITVDDARTVRLWDVQSGRLLIDPITHDKAVQTALFSPDGQRMLSVAEDGTRVFDIAGAERPVPRRELDGKTLALFSPDGRQLVVAVSDPDQRAGSIQLWQHDGLAPAGPPLRLQAPVWAMALRPDGRRLAVAEEGSRQVRIWALEPGVGFVGLDAETAAPPPPLLRGFSHLESVLGLAYSPDGRILATASNDHTARLWNADNGRPMGEPLRHRAPVNAVALSADGQRVVTASDDFSARIWRVADGQPLGPALEHGAPVRAVAFDAGGGRVATGSWDHNARVWDAATGAPVGQPMQHEDGVFAVAFARDGRLATGSRDGSARIWDADTGRPLGKRLGAGREVYTVAFDPADHELLTASIDGRVQLWPLAERPLHRAAPRPLLEAACQSVNAPARLLTERDVRAAKVVALSRVGHDVCPRALTERRPAAGTVQAATR